LIAVVIAVVIAVLSAATARLVALKKGGISPDYSDRLVIRMRRTASDISRSSGSE
jgi:hypothetical protein